MKLKTGRIEALTDGIFAIVMTIMVVGLIEIFNFTKPASEEDFYKLFSNLKDDFTSYVITFLVLGVLWLEHHWQFHFIQYINPVLVFLNIIWFMFICLIPFSAMLIGNHINFLAPIISFEFNILIASVILYLHWLYATHRHRLVDASLDRRTINEHRYIGLSLIIICLVALTLSLLNTALGLFVFIAAPASLIFYKTVRGAWGFKVSGRKETV